MQKRRITSKIQEVLFLFVLYVKDSIGYIYRKEYQILTELYLYALDINKEIFNEKLPLYFGKIGCFYL